MTAISANRKRYCHDQSGPEIPKEDEKRQDDECGSLKQSFLHRPRGLVDQLGLLIVGRHRDTFGKGGLNAFYFLVKTLNDLGAVLAEELEDNAGNDLFFSVSGNDASPDFVSVNYFGDVGHFDGDAILDSQRDVADILEALQKAQPPHEGFFRSEHQELPADILVVLRTASTRSSSESSYLSKASGSTRI